MPAVTSGATASPIIALPAPLALLGIIGNTTTTAVLRPLQRRLQPDTATDAPASGTDDLPPLSSVASIILSNFLPSYDTADATSSTPGPPAVATHTYNPPSIESLVASSAEDLSNFRDVTFDIFDDDDDLFGSPLAFDASENGLWNGRFVPPPPRPPFFVDEPVLSDGLTTCDLCSWAMPTKSTFIFEGTIEKASELGWPLTLIIVSILSALVGAIIMVTVVRCRRKKASNNRNETHVQWWSRNKRPNGNNNNNNHLRRSNIYTAHPADSIRGLGQPSLSAASSLTAMTAMGVSTTVAAVSANNTLQHQTQQQQQQEQQQQQQQYYLTHQHQQQQQHHYRHHHQHELQHQHQHQPLQHDYEYDHEHEHDHEDEHRHDHNHDHSHKHEYQQPQELHLQLQHHRQRRQSSSISSSRSSPTLLPATVATMMPMTLQPHHQHAHMQQHLRDEACHWPSATMMLAS